MASNYSISLVNSASSLSIRKGSAVEPLLIETPHTICDYISLKLLAILPYITIGVQMKEIENVLLYVKNNPAMVLGESSIRKLGLFIHAYICSIFRSGRSEETISQEIDLFRVWLKNKFKIKHMRAWYEILVFVSDDEWDALQKFWSLWNTFSKSPKCRAIKTTSKSLRLNPEMSSGLFDMLKEIKKKPVMYLQHESLSNLVAFLNGYVYALRQMGIPKDKEELEFEKFTYWLNKNYKKEGKIFSERPWWKNIVFFSENDRQAFNVFFDLFDRFTHSINETDCNNETSKL